MPICPDYTYLSHHNLTDEMLLIVFILDVFHLAGHNYLYFRPEGFMYRTHSETLQHLH